MATFPYAHQKVFVLNGTVSTTGTSANLQAGDFGMFDAKLNGAVTPALTATTPRVYLAQGSYYANDSIGNTPLVGMKESLKTPIIDAKYVTRFYAEFFKQPANHIIKIGGTPGLQYQSDYTYLLRVEAKGSPALRTLNRHLYKHVPFFTGCASDNCLSGCEKEYVDPTMVYKGWADYINADPLLSLFVKATPFAEFASSTGTWPVNSTILTVDTPTGWTVGQTVLGPGVYGKITAVNGLQILLDTPTTAAGAAATLSAGVVVDDNYVFLPNATAPIDAVAYLVLEAAYVDTVFSDCSFNPIDFYQKEPIILYASLVDETGNPCSVGPHINSNTNENTLELRLPVQPMGVGETVFRDYIEAREYDGIHFNRKPRKREVEQDPAFQVVSRTSFYNRYYLQFNVPRFSNSTNTFNNDQYLYCFAFRSDLSAAAFVGLVNAWLTSNNPSVRFESLV